MTGLNAGRSGGSGRRARATMAGLWLCAASFPIASAAADRHLWDEAHRLTARQRVGIEQSLTTAARRLESPLYVLIAERLRDESASQMAERLFAERALGGSARSNPVLLLVATRDNSAAVATGKGNAGIVPEMDARRIIADLTKHQLADDLEAPLLRAIAALAEAGEATLIRRRPLAPGDDDLPPPEEGATSDERLPQTPPSSDDPAGSAPSEHGASAAAPAEAADPDPTGAPQPAAPSRTSRVPIALGVGALFVLALALRRRQTLAATRREDAAGAASPPPTPRGPAPRPPRGRVP